MNKNYDELISDVADAVEILNVLIRKSEKDNYDLGKVYRRFKKTSSIERAYLESLPKREQTIHHVKRLIEVLYSEYDNKFGVWGWCTLNKAGCIIDCLEDIFETKASPVCVEVGVYGGKSVLPALLQLKRFGSGVFHGIDPWSNEEATKGYEEAHYEFWKNINLEYIYDIFKFVVEDNNCKDYIKVHRMPSDDAPVIEDIDFLYIDGQHTEQALRDAEKYASQVNVGGYCIADDIVEGWSPDSAIEKVPDLLVSMGFEVAKKVDMAVIFKRVSK